MLTTLSARRAGSTPATVSLRHGDVRHVVTVKRAREVASLEDGMRVLVDRLWPRGVPRERLIIDLWLRDNAPSRGLRHWYAHDPGRRAKFARQYRAELCAQVDLLHLLDDLRTRGRLTLLCDASDIALCHGVVLREVLIEARFPRDTSKGEKP
jgi:uncharacterized protein YeaO (DUF488 family)